MHRLFIIISTCLIVLSQAVSILAEEQERKLLIIVPGAHQDLDDADCMMQYTDQLKQHLEFIENNPDASYSVGNTYSIQHFLKTYPNYRFRLKELMRKDRIAAPALWVDLEPEWYTGEFLVRSVAYPKYLLKKELDYDTYWSHLNDVPSITPQWAQILRKSDIDIMIINPHRIPQMPQIAYYGAPDGSRILTWSAAYDALFDLVGGINLSLLAPWINNVSPLGYKLSQATHDFGIDLNQTQLILQTCRQWKDKYPDGPVIKLGTPQEFAAMAINTIKEKNLKLPELTGRVFAWPWAGEAWWRDAMRNHAMAENLLPVVEKLSAICELLGLEKYPLEEITHGWELILWSTDHNWGSQLGTRPMKMRDNKESSELAHKLLNKKLHLLASAVKYTKKGKPLFVFNSLNWSRTEPVTVELTDGKIPPNPPFSKGGTIPPFEKGGQGGFSVVDSEGKVTLSQIFSHKENNLQKLTFLAQNVPPMGYKCYYLVTDLPESQPQTDIKTGQDFIENQYYKIKVDKLKGVSSIYDKQYKHELLDQNSKYQLGYSNISREHLIPPFIPVQDVRVTAQGPLQASLEITSIFDNKPYIVRISLSAYNRNIDLRLRLEREPILTPIYITFPFNVGNSKYNIMLGLAFGCIPNISDDMYNYKAFKRLPEHGFNYNFDSFLDQQPVDQGNVAQMWFTHGGADDDYAIDVALDGIQARTYILDVGRKKIPAIHVLGQIDTKLFGSMPKDHHIILRGHLGDWRATHTPRLGWETNNPLLATVASGAGNLPEESSFITLETASKGQNIILSAFKKAFDGNGYVLRFYESEDADANVAVTVNPQLNIPRAEVSRTNLVEKPFQVLDSATKNYTIPVLGFGIETMRFFQTAVTDIISPARIDDLKASNPTSRSVELSWSATGDDGKKGRAATYDLRYARQPLTNDSWSQALKVDYRLAPKESGTKEQCRVTKLEPDTKYYFAIKAIDKADNTSPVSNLAEITTKSPAIAKPAQITDLKAVSSGASSITINWTATGGDGTQGRAEQYDLRYSTTSIDATAWFMATKANKVISPTPAGKKESFTLSGLEPNSSYYIALKAINEEGNESSISNIVQQNTSQLKNLILQNGLKPTPNHGVQDTFISHINQEEQEVNNADSHVMELWAGGGRAGLIKFDLSLLPPHANIYQAKLKLYCLNVTYTDAGIVQCYRLTQNWKDMEATWKLAMNKMPWKGGLQERIDTGSNYGFGGNGLIGQADVKNGGMWVVWDVTKVIQEWSDGKYPNYGWLIRGKCSDDCGINFCSSKYKKSKELRPILEIKYD